MLRKVATAVLLAACVGGVVGFQATRPSKAAGDPQVFVPSPRFYMEFSPSIRTTVADAYWLLTIQYYGDHVKGDGRLDSLPDMLNLVTTLSPRFEKAYLFGAFALVDAGKFKDGYELLLRGAEALPSDWRVASTLGAFIYQFASNADKASLAAKWYEKAAGMKGRPDWVPRVAAALLGKGGQAEKAALLWAQIYGTGDEYSRQKALVALNRLLPTGRQAREEALASLEGVLTPAQFDELSAILLHGL